MARNGRERPDRHAVESQRESSISAQHAKEDEVANAHPFSNRTQSGFTLEKILREHADPVSCIAWSPDDSILLTAAEAIIKMWNTEVSRLPGILESALFASF